MHEKPPMPEAASKAERDPQERWLSDDQIRFDVENFMQNHWNMVTMKGAEITPKTRESYANEILHWVSQYEQASEESDRESGLWEMGIFNRYSNADMKRRAELLKEMFEESES